VPLVSYAEKLLGGRVRRRKLRSRIEMTASLRIIRTVSAHASRVCVKFSDILTYVIRRNLTYSVVMLSLGPKNETNAG
jgi:hypothetical protein